MVLLLYMSMVFYVVAILVYTCLRYFPSMSDVTPKYVSINLLTRCETNGRNYGRKRKLSPMW